MSSHETSSTIPVHLLVVVHGMWGNPSHLAEASRFIREKADKRVKEIQNDSNDGQAEFNVLVAQANQQGSTYDGIDWGSERIADEIYEYIGKLESNNEKKVTRFSVLGYSLGGLLGRYVIGILQSRKFFDNVQPINFNTIATPHIGLPRYPGSLWSTVTNTLGPRLLSRTGEQFFTVDQWGSSGKPLLEVMAEPETIFMQALKRFENIAIYANAVNDLTVPYVTASINEEDPFANHEATGLEIEFLEGYSPVVASYSEPETPPPKPKGPAPFSKEWFISIKEYRPPLPPFLQRPFPMNLVLYAAVPIILPTFICLALIRLSLDSRASRARIKLLEEAAHDSDAGPGRLITLLRDLEKEMDDAVAEFVDSSGPEPSYTDSPPVTSNKGSSDSSESSPEDRKCSEKRRKLDEGNKSVPTLKPSQKRMVKSLNSNLKQMKKYDVYIHPIRNAHGTIVVRDARGFEFHRIGEGVLRHWSDGFVF